MSKEMVKEMIGRFVTGSDVDDVMENVAGRDSYAVFGYIAYKQGLQESDEQ